MIGRIARFTVVGSAGAITYLLVGWFSATVLSFHETIAGTLAFVVVVAQNYVLHYFWTFASAAEHWKSGSRFVITTLAGLLLNAAIIHLLVTRLALSILPAQLIAMCFVIALNFVSYFVWVFGVTERKTRDQAQ